MIMLNCRSREDEKRQGGVYAEYVEIKMSLANRRNR